MYRCIDVYKCNRNIEIQKYRYNRNSRNTEIIEKQKYRNNEKPNIQKYKKNRNNGSREIGGNVKGGLHEGRTMCRKERRKDSMKDFMKEGRTI